MGADVLLEHAAESRPQMMKSPVKREDTVTQSMAAKWTHLQTEIQKKAHITWREQDKSSKSFIPITLHFPMCVNETDMWKSRSPQNFKTGQCSAISRYTADECVCIFHLHKYWNSDEIRKTKLNLWWRFCTAENSWTRACCIRSLTGHDKLPVILSQEAKSPGCASWHSRLFKIKVRQPTC